MYCTRCGRHADTGNHTACRAAASYEPPRYCRACARRMVVQVSPSGWSARCSAHGTVVNDVRDGGRG